MSITAARLQAEVGASTKDFDAGMAHADRTVAAAPGKWSRAMKIGAGAGLAVGAGLIVRGLAGGINAGVTSLKELGVITAQTNAVIKSTGGAANVTAGEIRALATALEDKTATDDKVIQSGQNLLLTFKGIRNEAGAGNDIFNQTTAALVDMNRALGGDISTQAIQLGKALNDPTKGLSALTKAGVVFDDQQKKRIEQFVKEGKVIEAQKIILAELNTEFHGSGAAFRATDVGQAEAYGDAIEGIQQSLARSLLPAITRVQGQLTKFLGDPATMAQAEALGSSIAGIFSEGNLSTAASAMTTAAGAISTAIKLFSSLPPQVQALAVGAIALKKITGIGPLDIAKGAGGLLKIAFERGSTPANPLFVTGVGAGGVGGVPGAAGKGAGVASALTKVFLAGAAIGIFSELKGILDDQSAANKTQIVGQGKQNEVFVKGATLNDMKSSLEGLVALDRKLNSELTPEAIAYQINMDGVRDSLEARIRELKAAIVKEEAAGAVKTVHATERQEAILSSKIVSTAAAIVAKVGGAATAAREAGSQMSSAVERKKMSFTSNVSTTVVTDVSISNRDIVKNQQTFKTRGKSYAL